MAVVVPMTVAVSMAVAVSTTVAVLTAVPVPMAVAVFAMDVSTTLPDAATEPMATLVVAPLAPPAPGRRPPKPGLWKPPCPKRGAFRGEAEAVTARAKTRKEDENFMVELDRPERINGKAFYARLSEQDEANMGRRTPGP